MATQKFEETVKVDVHMEARLRTILRTGAIIAGVVLVLFLAGHAGLTPEQIGALLHALLK